MSRTRSWPTTAVGFLAACALHVAQPGRSATAQQPSATPDELTQAILRYAFRYDGSNARLLEGRVPDDLGPNFYVPPGTRVLGSVVTGSTVVVLAKSSASAESLRAEYRRVLGPRGWKAVETMRRGGFVDARVDLPLVLCREGAQLHVQHIARTVGANDLFLQYREGSGGCDEMGSPPAFRRMAEPQFPTLYSPPSGVRELSMRCFSQRSGHRGSMSTATMVPLTANMTAEELLRHYARQVESEGWRRAPSDGRSVASGTWTRADSVDTADLNLQVRETGTSGFRCYDVEMRVSSGAR